MTDKELILQPAAEHDIDAALAYYRHEGGAALASRWARALDAALRHVASCPASDSPRYGELLGLQGLRFWQVRRFPYLVFYVETAQHVGVWRVLHAARDIPPNLAQED